MSDPYERFFEKLRQHANSFSVGDAVQYTAAMVRTMANHGNCGAWIGEIESLEPVGEDRYMATVQWSHELRGESMRVLTSNLAKPRTIPACEANYFDPPNIGL